MRDFYDVTTLFNRYKDSINYENLASAFNKTCIKRESLPLLDEANDILDSIESDSNLQNLWNSYCKKQKYANHIEFSTNLETIEYLIKQIRMAEVNNHV